MSRSSARAAEVAPGAPATGENHKRVVTMATFCDIARAEYRISEVFG